MDNDFTDSYGAIYSADRKVLIQGPLDCEEYSIHDGTEVIGESAFRYRMSRLFSASVIHIPQSVRVIKRRAFERCSAVITTNLPSVEIIEGNAFWGANGIEELHCPNLRSLGDHAFIHSNLCRIDIGDKLEEVGINPFAATPVQDITCSSPNYTVIDETFFVRKAERIELIACLSDIQYADIPGSITIIKENALSYLAKLKGISVDAQTVEPHAISSCPRLHLAIFGQSVNTIGDGNLSGCPKLHTVVFDHYSNFPPLGVDMFESRGIPKHIYVHDDANFILTKYPKKVNAIEKFPDINTRFTEPSVQYQIGQATESNTRRPHLGMSPLEFSDAFNSMSWDRECAKTWYAMAQFGRHPSREAHARLREMENEQIDYTCDNSHPLEA
jgi:hypothetical protein